MKLIITGGAGFIGSNFVRFALKNCPTWQIWNVDALTYAGNRENMADFYENERHNFVHADVADESAMETLFVDVKPDAVIHFAAETHVDRSITDPNPFVRTNILGTKNLLELSVKYGIKKYHQISTDEVYGDLGDTKNTYFTEKTPVQPNCPYAATKASADLLVQSWHETYKLHTIITRCSNNYGPYQFPEKLIPFFLKKAMRNEDLPVYGDGKHVRDWLYVEDHCEAILTAFEKSDAGEVWNIGGHNEKTNLEIVEQILSLVPNTTSKIVFVKDRAAHDRRYAMDPTKIQEKHGWKPKWTFEEALPMTINWYLANEDWVHAVSTNK